MQVTKTDCMSNFMNQNIQNGNLEGTSFFLFSSLIVKGKYISSSFIGIFWLISTIDFLFFAVAHMRHVSRMNDGHLSFETWSTHKSKLVIFWGVVFHKALFLFLPSLIWNTSHHSPYRRAERDAKLHSINPDEETITSFCIRFSIKKTRHETALPEPDSGGKKAQWKFGCRRRYRCLIIGIIITSYALRSPSNASMMGTEEPERAFYDKLTLGLVKSLGKYQSPV